MPKQKTHHATKKVLRKSASGNLKYKKSGGNHNTAKDSTKQVRQRRKQGTLSKSFKKLGKVI